MSRQPKIDFKGSAQAAQTENTDGENVLALCRKMEIDNGAELRFAVSAIAEIKDKIAVVSEKRDKYVKPLREIANGMDAEWKPALDSLTESERVLKGQIIAYDTALRSQRGDLLAKVKNAGIEDRADLIARASSFIMAKVDGMSFRRPLEINITDTSRAVAWCIENNRIDLLTIDTKAVKALIKKIGIEGARDETIPGVVAEEKATVAITAAKVNRI